LVIFKMTASAQQRLFNQYPSGKAFAPDIWHGRSKEEKRNSATALTYAFLLDGGTITKCPPAKRGKGRPEIFKKDTRASAAHERWNKKFLAGDDFVQKGPRFLSKPISERAADQRDIERKAGISHATFNGAVVDLNGKLEAKKASHATTEYLVDLVSEDALRASAKRDGGRHAQKIVQLVEDTGDDLSDAYRRATIRDDLNLNGIDHAHNSRFKLAA
jgi:hypothetical protein